MEGEDGGKGKGRNVLEGATYFFFVLTASFDFTRNFEHAESG